jgi:hypothetical protein
MPSTFCYPLRPRFAPLAAQDAAISSMQTDATKTATPFVKKKQSPISKYVNRLILRHFFVYV